MASSQIQYNEPQLYADPPVTSVLTWHKYPLKAIQFCACFQLQQNNTESMDDLWAGCHIAFSSRDLFQYISHISFKSPVEVDEEFQTFIFKSSYLINRSHAEAMVKENL